MFALFLPLALAVTGFALAGYGLGNGNIPLFLLGCLVLFGVGISGFVQSDLERAKAEKSAHSANGKLSN